MIDWEFTEADERTINLIAELAILFGTNTMHETLDRALIVMHDIAIQFNEGCDMVYVYKEELSNG